MLRSAREAMVSAIGVKIHTNRPPFPMVGGLLDWRLNNERLRTGANSWIILLQRKRERCRWSAQKDSANVANK